jgi:hypothetical protein
VQNSIFEACLSPEHPSVKKKVRITCKLLNTWTFFINQPVIYADLRACLCPSLSAAALLSTDFSTALTLDLPTI